MGATIRTTGALSIAVGKVDAAVTFRLVAAATVSRMRWLVE